MSGCWIDEVSDRDGDGWQAVCEDCQWVSPIQHADEFFSNEDPSDAAYAAAVMIGRQHSEARHA